MDILRFITAGNVDDGKSTLIGRLLYDTNNIKTDVLESVSDNDTAINLAHITDGLRAERQQGITIDVAYKYFAIPGRKYIITDAPGHFQYTKNLVTGASGVDAMIILIDAQNGITDQTRRHSLVASFLKTDHIVVAINKMDIVGYDEQVFTAIKNEYLEIARKLQLPSITFIPISALAGDNVSIPSEIMKWYKGETLMQYLENCRPAHVQGNVLRFSVQFVINNGDKGYAGKILSGTLKTGDIVATYPGRHMAVVHKIIQDYNEVSRAEAGQNITVYLAGEHEAVRGNLIAYFNKTPKCGNHIEATICWLNADEPLQVGKEYFLRINAMETTCIITEVVYKVDNNSFEQYNDGSSVAVNEFAKVKIKTTDTIAYDMHSQLPENGRGIIIDASTNYTSGAFVIES